VAGGRLLRSDGEGVVVTFFLMRYQRAVARRREVSFAGQLFRISFFMTMEQDFAEALPETFGGKVAFNPPAITN
jgi:hypothetical protein